jgi:3-isopropylmalate/(R)-2-methylmalate dehydratase small subunit
VVSSFFADIFRGNCLNVGILPVQVSPSFLQKILTSVEASPDAVFEVNLPDQSITDYTTGTKEFFEINGYKKNNLLNGFDDIDYLQAMKPDIAAFAASRPM